MATDTLAEGRGETAAAEVAGAGKVSSVELALLCMALATFGQFPLMSDRESVVCGALVGLLALWFAWRRCAAGVLVLAFPVMYLVVLPAMRLGGLGRSWGWPWPMMVPLLAVLGLMVACRPLRRRMAWLRPGRIDAKTLMWTLLIVAASAVGLVVWFAAANRGHVGASVFGLSGWKLVLAGAGFALLNSVMEEIPFRGVLQPALEELGAAPGLAIGVQGILFGLGHLNGFPSGISGCVLAGLYGIALGMLRRSTNGLLAPTLAHVAADVTIVCIVAHAVT